MTKTWIIVIVILILIAVGCYFVFRKPKTAPQVAVSQVQQEGNLAGFLTALIPAGEKVLENYIGKGQVNPSPKDAPIQAGSPSITVVKDGTKKVVQTAPTVSSIYDIIGTSQNYKG